MKKFAFIFPGQGSQSIKMVSDLAKKYSIIKDTFYEASSVLNYDLWKLIQNGPNIELNKTYRTQPAILAASVSIWRAWKKEKGEHPTLMAGHSLGEYSALVCSETIKFQDAIRLVEMRGKLMEETFSQETSATLAIIGLSESIVINIFKKISEEKMVFLVNYNSPDQIVISGKKKAVELFGIICKSKGAKHIFQLPISVPVHCILMKPAAKKLADELKKVQFYEPKIPVVNNVDIKCETIPDLIRSALIRQLYNPIKWTKIVKYIILKKRIKHFYEVGPGNVLTNLTKKINNSIVVLTINKLNSFLKVLSQYKKKENYHEL